VNECNHAVAGSCAKCEPCGVCGRPRGDPHRYPVAGECTAPDSSDYTVSLQCLSIALRKAQDDVKAAEERGRRHGVEERDELRALLRKCRPHVRMQTSITSGREFRETVDALIADIDAALAPRASHASEGPPCAGCGHAKWRHQYSSKEHAFCSEPIGRDYCRCANYLAPRDSARCPDGDPYCSCQKPMDAPRDSGKVEP
jgi:hypothetical protein